MSAIFYYLCATRLISRGSLMHQHAGGAIGMETGCFAFFEESEGSQMQCRFGYRMHGIGMGDDTCLGRRGMAPRCVQT